MGFFQCPTLDGTTQQDLAALGTPAFLRVLPVDPITPAGGTRVFFSGVAPGVPPYASTTLARAAVSAGLLAASPDFAGVDFPENASAPAPTITVNALGGVASLELLDASLLAPGVASAVRVTFNGGVYCDVQGTLASVSAALNAGSGGGGVVGPSNVAYVNVEGTAAGAVGDAARPFATVAQALAALAAVAPPLAFAQVRIGPGDFTADVGVVPPSLTRFSIIGSGVQLTRVNGVTPGAILFDLGVGVPRDDAQFVAFTPTTQGGALALRYDGAAAFGPGPTDNAFQRGALVWAASGWQTGGLDVRRCGTLATIGAISQTSSCVVESVVQWLAGDGSFLGDVTLTADWDDPRVVAVAPPKLQADWFGQVLAGFLHLEKQGRVEGQSGTNIDGTLTTLTGLTVSAPATGNKTGGFTLRGAIARKVLFGAGVALIPDVPQAFKLDFSDGLVREDFAMRVAGAPPANAQACDLRDTDFDRNGGAPVPVIGAGIHADVRGAIVAGGDFSTPDASGDVFPSPFSTASTPVAGLAQVVPFPFRIASADYAATVDADNATTLPLSVNPRTVNDCTVNVTVAAGNVRVAVTPRA